MKKSILFTVFGIALQMMVACRSYCQQTVTVETYTDTDTPPTIHDFKVMYESQIQAEKKLQESRTQYLISAIALEGIVILILIPIVFVQRRKINRLRNN